MASPSPPSGMVPKLWIRLKAILVSVPHVTPRFRFAVGEADSDAVESEGWPAVAVEVLRLLDPAPGTAASAADGACMAGPASSSTMLLSRAAGGLNAPNRSQHWIPSTNQHPIGMGTKESISHGACGVEWSREMRERWSKMMSKLPHAQRSSNAEFATATGPGGGREWR